MPDAHDPSKRRPPSMLTTDLSLRFDPAYEKISRRFYEHPDEFADAFRPGVVQADPPRHGADRALPGPAGSEGAPAVAGSDSRGGPQIVIGDKEIAALKAKILKSGLSISQLVTTAWASASSFRGSDKRGGANGARIRLAPQKDWEVNQPAELAKVLQKLEAIQTGFNGRSRAGKRFRLPT